ncbi:MAG: DUF2341 domain-containing protein, partial [Candidatus Micrarchaeota archaeon]
MKLKINSIKTKTKSAIKYFLVFLLIMQLSFAWWNSSWSYRMPINVSSISGNLNDYQINLTVNTQTLISAGKMRSDCGDIRFANSTDNELNYWIESGCNTSATKIWVKVPNLINNTNSTIYLYYGNSGASSVSSVTNTFIREISGLKGAWNLDEGTGNTTSDTSGNGNNGTINGANWTTGKFGNALDFDGVNDWVNPNVLAGSLGLSGNAKKTVITWFKMKTKGGFIGWGNNGGTGTMFGFGVSVMTAAGKLEFWGQGADLLGDTVVSTEVWHSGAITYNGSVVSLYLDGTINGTASLSLNTGNNYLGIGQAKCEGYEIISPYNGTLDAVQIYNQSLTADDISALYSDYGYTTTNYPGRVLVKKYASPEPTSYLGSEQTIPLNPVNLTIFDETDSQTKYVNEQVKFYANFSNTSGQPINQNGTYCQISFNNTGIWSSYVNMTYNNSSLLYQYNLSYSASGTFFWNVTCNGSAAGYEIANKTNEVVITNKVPQYSNISVNNSNPFINQSVLHSVYWTDDQALDSFIFSSNYSGAWVNESSISFSSGWWNSSWSYRMPINVSSISGNLNDYQINLTVNTQTLISAGKMRSDCGDIRFANSTDNELNYWIESGCNTSATKIWVKVPNLINNTNSTIYLYYGNSGASSVSSVTNTFIREISGLKGAWNLDEGTGNTTSDTSGNGNNGTINGANWTTGKFGNALDFDGVNDWVNPNVLAGSLGLSGNAKKTVITWFKMKTKGGFIGWGNNGGTGTMFGFGVSVMTAAGKLEFWGQGADLLGDTVVSTEVWHSGAITYNGSVVSLYLDGTINGTASLSLNTGNNYLGIGQAKCEGYEIISPYNGTLDAVQIYNQSLTADDISALYSDYGYTTTNYPGRVLVKKYASPEPTSYLGSEQNISQSSSCTSLTACWSNYTKNVSSAPGTYGWRIYTKDSNNALTDTGIQNIIVSEISVSINITHPVQNTSYNTGDVDLNYTTTGLGTLNCSYSFDNGATNTSLPSCTNTGLINLTNGNYSLTMYVNDSYGNKNSSQVNFSINVSVPNIVIISPENKMYNKTNISINFTLSGWKITNCFYSINNSQNITIPDCANTSINKSDGSYLLTVYANNSGGVNSSSVAFSIHTVPPTIVIIDPTQGKLCTNNVSLIFTASDSVGISKCWYSLDGGDGVNIANCANITINVINSGAHNLIVYANDSAGNVDSSGVSFTTNSTTKTIFRLGMRNRLTNKIYLTKIELDELEYTFPNNGIEFMPNQKKSVYIEVPGSRCATQNQLLQFNKVVIYYNTKELSDVSQIGTVPLVGKCS